MARDTEIVLDTRASKEISFDTPRLAQPLNNEPSMAFQRTTIGGTAYGTLIQSEQPIGSWARLRATPTERVRTGQFRFWAQALLGRSEVAMSIKAPGGRVLPVLAPLHTLANDMVDVGARIPVQDGYPGWVPFTGTHDRTLVDVGGGSTEDIAGQDLRGKMALLESGKTVAEQTACTLDIDRLRAVHAAGAAGVVAYPAPDHQCHHPVPVPLMIGQKPFSGAARTIGIPNVSLSSKEGVALRRRLGSGPVTIRVEATPETPYTYALKPYEEGRIPASLRYSFDTRHLGQVERAIHAPRNDTTFADSQKISKPTDVVVSPLSMSLGLAAAFTGPHTFTEYFGPVSPKVIRVRSMYGRQGGNAAEGATNQLHRVGRPALFVQPERRREHWFVTPKTPGTVVKTPRAIHDLIGPTKPEGGLGTCSLCREGDLLWPVIPMVTGDPDHLQDDAGSGRSTSPEEGSRDLELHLYKGNDEIPRVPVLFWRFFKMPAEEADYRLTARGPSTDATWTFRSGRPTTSTRTPGYTCPLETYGATDPCSPLPMVFAGFDLAESLTMENKVPDRGLHRFTVHAYHADSTERMPEVDGLKLWLSYDGGAEWIAVKPTPLGDGNFSVAVQHPPAGKRPSDSVSLKVETWDTAGNRLEQVTRDAFKLAR